MKRSRKQPDTGRPEELADRARAHATQMMRTIDSVPPTGIADTDGCHVFRKPAEPPDDRAKDRFAEGARMFAVAVRARAPVMIAEAWVRLPDATGHLDTSVGLSQAPGRREMVAPEDTACSATRRIPIIRHERGRFAGFGDGGAPDHGEGRGRFARLTPRRKPGSADVEKARKQLDLPGMRIENRGVDPGLN